MFKGMTALLTVSLLAVVAMGDDKISQKDAEVRMAIALHKAKRTQYAAKAKTDAIPYKEAMVLSVKTGKPIFVAVNAECRTICSELRPDFLTCHETEFAGSKQVRYILSIPSKGKFLNLQWETRPTPADVRRELKKWAAESKVGLGSMEEAGALLAMVTLGVMPTEEVSQVEFIQTCPGGVCPDAPQTVQARGSGGQTVYYGYPQAVQEGGGEFVARFPRIARIRGRVRQALGMQPPQRVAGYYQPAPQQAVAAQAATAAEARVVGAAKAREHRLIKEFLVRHGVPRDDLDKAEAKLGGDFPWAKLLQLFLEEGVPIILEWLKNVVG